MIAVKIGRELKVANIGDSGFLQLRFSDNQGDSLAFCVTKSKEQQHGFNVPYQLSKLPSYKQLEELYQQGKLKECHKLLNVLKKKHTICQDDPNSADEYSLNLQDEDVIVSGTDGVFDNLFTHEILSIVSSYRQEQPSQKLWKESQANELAKMIVQAAKKKFSPEHRGAKTPYQRKFKKCFNALWTVSTL